MSNSFATPWTVAHQAPLSMDFPGKNTGVGCYFLLQGIFWPRDQTRVSCLAGGFFIIEPPRKHQFFILKDKLAIKLSFNFSSLILFSPLYLFYHDIQTQLPNTWWHILFLSLLSRKAPFFKASWDLSYRALYYVHISQREGLI